MHYQSPPLIHRDLKVENILLTPPQTYKLCDFGSTTKPLPKEKVPTAVEGIQKIEMEINKTTTLQYRAPELVDVWGRKGFDEKIGEFAAISYAQFRAYSKLISKTDDRYLGSWCPALQTLLLYDAFRRTWSSSDPQRSIQGEIRIWLPLLPLLRARELT